MEAVTILSRSSIIPGHEDAYIKLWEREVDVREKYGFVIQNAFVETGQGTIIRLPTLESEKVAYDKTGEERILTCLYSFEGDIEAAEKRFNLDAKTAEITTSKRDYITGDEEIRRVTPRMLKPATEDSLNKMIIMRRYNIKNDWGEFIDVWKDIVPVREKYGFEVLFAVEDVEEKVFSWAFTYNGDSFATFMSEGQKEYYSDPKRVLLKTVNKYLDEVRLTPSRQLEMMSNVK